MEVGGLNSGFSEISLGCFICKIVERKMDVKATR